MSRSTRPSSVPPLRLRHGESEDNIIDIAWSADPSEINPPTIAFLNKGESWAGAKSTWDVEDPTDPDNDDYPPDEAALLSAVELVRCAASHWQRVRPGMQRFTQTELADVDFLAGLGGVQAGLKRLVECRKHDCAFVLERRFEI